MKRGVFILDVFSEDHENCLPCLVEKSYESCGFGFVEILTGFYGREADLRLEFESKNVKNRRRVQRILSEGRKNS